MLRVAAHRRASPARLYRRAAFAWLCVEFAFVVTREQEHADAASLVREADRLNLSVLTNFAFHDGKALKESVDTYAAKVRALLAPPVPESLPRTGLDVLREALAESAAREAAHEPLSPEVT